MDESYPKVARAFVQLGRALDDVCVSVEPRLQSDPRLDIVRQSAHQFLRFGIAAEKNEPDAIALMGRFTRPEVATRLESTANILEIVGRGVAEAHRGHRGLSVSIVEDAGVALYEIEPLISRFLPGARYIAEVLPGDPEIHGKPRPRPRPIEPPATPAPTSPRPSEETGDGSSEASLNWMVTSLLKDFDNAG
jgi:hypothetical protein